MTRISASCRTHLHACSPLTSCVKAPKCFEQGVGPDADRCVRQCKEPQCCSFPRPHVPFESRDLLLNFTSVYCLLYTQILELDKGSRMKKGATQDAAQYSQLLTGHLRMECTEYRPILWNTLQEAAQQI